MVPWVEGGGEEGCREAGSLRRGGRGSFLTILVVAVAVAVAVAMVGRFSVRGGIFFFFLMIFLWFWVLVFEVKKTVTQIKETRETALIIMKQNWVKEVLLCLVLLDWYELKVYCLIFSGKVLRKRNKRAGSEGSVRLDFCRFFLVLLKTLGHFAVFVIKFQEDFGLCLCLRFIERLGVD